MGLTKLSKCLPNPLVNGVADNPNDLNTTEDQKLELEYRKLEDDLMFKMKDLSEKIRSNKENEKNERKKIAASKNKPTTNK